MKFNLINEVKERRRAVARELKQLDSLLAGFAGLTAKREEKPAAKPKKVKAVRKPRSKKPAVELPGTERLSA